MKHIIANWKIKLTPDEEIALAHELAATDFKSNEVAVSLCPSFLTTKKISEILNDTNYTLGVQDAFWEEKGAYTGEVSPQYLKDMGVTMFILGHSERRVHVKETDEMVNRKVHAVIDHHCTPILCVGESREERESGSKDHIIHRQVEKGLENIKLVGNQKLIVAYEPVWAINSSGGKSQAAEVEDVTYMHEVIYHTLLDMFARDMVENNIAVIYGGSVDGASAPDLFKEDIIHGALVGTASVQKETFMPIIEAAYA